MRRDLYNSIDAGAIAMCRTNKFQQFGKDSNLLFVAVENAWQTSISIYIQALIG